jgi:hypothetical protein
VQRFLAFWWECIANARRGSSAFANDWQWLIGFPALAAILWFFRAYLSNYAQLFSAETAFGTFMAALVAFFITLIARFFVRLLIEPSNLFYRERDRAANAEHELQSRLSPKISVSLDEDCGGIRIVETRINPAEPSVTRHPSPPEKWVQIKVISATDAPLIDCEARLVRVERVGSAETAIPILTEPTFCTWSMMTQSEQKRMTIPAKIPQSANIFSIAQGSTHLVTRTAHVHVGFDQEIQKPGRYRLTIGVSAKDCPTEIIVLILEWGGSYDKITITKK